MADSLIRAGFQVDSLGRLMVPGKAFIEYPKIEGSAEFHLQNLHFTAPVVIKLKNTIRIDSCTFENTVKVNSAKSAYSIFFNKFFQGFSLTGSDNLLWIAKNDFTLT